MDYIDIRKSNFPMFQHLARNYYRDGEDAGTPQDQIDSFIQYLFDLVEGCQIMGYIVLEKNLPIGFILFGVDNENLDFSEITGAGTIMEIGLIDAFRGQGRGKQIVSFAEGKMLELGVKMLYVTAYGPAQTFWLHNGYSPNGAIAANGLPLMVKQP